MYFFSIAGGLIGLGHIVMVFRRFRLSLIVAAALWLIYAVYEWHVANGVLCTENCNIRVDLVLFLPILIVASAYAKFAYERPPEQRSILGWVLGAVGLGILAMLLPMFGFNTYAAVVGLIAIGLAVYAVKLKRDMKLKGGAASA